MTAAPIARVRADLSAWLCRQADPRVEATGRIVLRNLNWLEREPWRPGLLAMTAANVARLERLKNGR